MHVLQYSWFWQYSQLVQSAPQGHSPSQPHTCPQQHSTFLLPLLPVVLSSLPANAITENITATQATKANITDFFIFVYKFDCYTCKDCNNKRNSQKTPPPLTYFNTPAAATSMPHYFNSNTSTGVLSRSGMAMPASALINVGSQIMNLRPPTVTNVPVTPSSPSKLTAVARCTPG